MKKVTVTLIILALVTPLAYDNKSEKPSSNGEPLISPLDPSLKGIERGREIYRRYGCHLCHGKQGEKGIRNINTQTANEIPALTYVAEGYTREELKAQIQKGVWDIPREDPKGPIPPFRMPSWKDIMPQEDLDALADYLISLMPKEAEEEW